MIEATHYTSLSHLSACFFTFPLTTTSSPTPRLFGIAWQNGRLCKQEAEYRKQNTGSKLLLL